MMKLLFGFAILPFMAVIAIAGKTALLNDVQMDQATAGSQMFTIVENIPSLLARDKAITITTMGGSFGEIPAGAITAGFLSLPAQSISIPSTTITVTSALP